MHQWKGLVLVLVHPLVLANLGKRTPFPCHLHNLNHIISAFSYPCSVLPWLALAYLSLHLTPDLTGVLTYQHTWFCLFLFFFRSLHQSSIFCLSLLYLSSDKFVFLRFLPQGLVSHFFTSITFLSSAPL